MKPVYGQGFFHVGLDGRIWYTIIFDYVDPERYYYSILRRGGRRLAAEEEELKSNMQRLMDEEKVVINGEGVRPFVESAFIEVRGDPSRPSVVFLVRMDYRVVRGRNVYEDFYEKTTAEYDYTVTWIVPPCGVIEMYEGPGRHEIRGNMLRLYVRSGTKIPGYESVVFNLSKCGTP